MNRLQQLFSEAWPTLKQTCRRYPAELAIVLYGFVCSVLGEEDILRGGQLGDALWALLPVLVLTYAANILTLRHPRRRPLYRFAWLLLLPAVWVGSGWLSTSQQTILQLILCPLALLLCRRAGENRRFTHHLMTYAAALCTALFFAGIFFLLVETIYRSASYIFNIWEGVRSEVWDYNTLISFLLLAPTLFFALADTFGEEEWQPGRAGAGFINWLLTPALLVYTVILYLYAAKILLQWELPKGGVAYMVLGYTAALIAVKALRELLPGSRPFEGFFRRFPLVTAAPLLLFWLGFLRRIGEYGFTDWRVYLLICGAICTAAALLFLHPRTGRYHYVAALAFGLFFLAAFFPPLSADRVGIRSQERRALQLAQEAWMLLPDNRLDLTPRSEADTVHIPQYAELGRALDYLCREDREQTFARFGLKEMEPYYDLFPRSYKNRVQYPEWRTDTATAEANLCLRRNRQEPIVLDGYRTFYPLDERLCGDTLRIGFRGRELAIAKRALLAGQMERAGLSWEQSPAAADFERRSDVLLTCDCDTLRLLFAVWSLDLEKRELNHVELVGILAR